MRKLRKIYVASSWRNPIQQEIVGVLRSAGHEVYDFRNPDEDNHNHGFGWSQIDPNWQSWTPEQYTEHLYSDNPIIERGFALDAAALDWADTCVLVLPCGRSAHLEAGYAIGQGKPTIFYLHPDKFEPELMYKLGSGCVNNQQDLLDRVDNPWMIWGTGMLQTKLATWFAANGGIPAFPNVLLRAKKEFDELLEVTTAKSMGADADAGFNDYQERPDIREEMADVGICLMMAADILGFNLLAEMRAKHTINQKRKWVVDELGCLRHIKGTDPRGESK